MMKTNPLLLLFIIGSCFSQIKQSAENSTKASVIKTTKNTHNSSLKAVKSIAIDDCLMETSGLIAFDNLLWTHNDSKDTTLYGLDLNGTIQKKQCLDNTVNTDWEELSQDETYLYISDSGNNVHGNRKDLQILRIEKKSFLAGSPLIDSLWFYYSDQGNFDIQKGNTTNYDCEAMVVLQDSIYLFTKQWRSQKTAVYSLPKTPGKQEARLKRIIDVKGLITGSTFLKGRNTIVLCGYSKRLQPFLFLLYDIKNNDLATAKHRKIKLRLPFHQIESLASLDEKRIYFTNESFILKPFLHIGAQLHWVDLDDF